MVRKISVSDFDILTNEEMVTMFPQSFFAFVECVGLKNTLLLVNSFGGVNFQFPKGDKPSQAQQKIIDCIGVQATDKLMAWFGGDKLYIPRCDKPLREVRNRQFCAVIDNAIKAGQTQATALNGYSYEFGFSERRGFTIFSKHKAMSTPAP